MTEAGRQTGRWRVFFFGGGGQSFPANVANVRFRKQFWGENLTTGSIGSAPSYHIFIFMVLADRGIAN